MAVVVVVCRPCVSTFVSHFDSPLEFSFLCEFSYTTYLVSTCDAGTYWAQFAGEGE